EIAFSEVRLADDGETGTKELCESGLKAPKMLKDFFVSLTNAFPSCIHKAKIAAFIISGFHISVIILDSPKGSACRLTYSERVEFPTDPDVCVKQLVPIMELV
ncbi:hypothetical protein BDB00DRAFT_740586, partial [Zychaea mexicana]|uniref:uncharacterized protein n=1 Tax=Zychaea mexicana TaxID=64656 RepID=UPI0022FE87E3